MTTNVLDRLSFPQFNNAAYLTLCQEIRKGVPNYLIRGVICKIISFDDDIARSEYYSTLNSLDPEPDFANLLPTAEPLFGRKDLTNVFLTMQGMISCKAVLHLLQKKLGEIEVCLILPRVIQLML